MARTNIRPKCLEPGVAETRRRPLTVKQAASASNVSQSLIYDWCRRGLLRHVRLPGRNGRGWKILISECDLVAFLDRHTVEPGHDYDAVALKHIRQPASKASRITKRGTASP
jgi:excisionase family DNA binding protein